ncbi:hypothetical protein KA021_02630 [Candidatus Saccharibacteria bacterium]|jgi:hypothetical protein|nr:hypothetical protein [Candidatus Saccharibacteria bacterium]
MKNLKNILPLLLSAGTLFALMLVVIPGTVSAQSADTCERNPANCGTGRTIQPGSGSGEIDENNPILKKVILPFSQGLAALVGVVVVLSIVISGIQYSSARDNPQVVAAAKNRIVMSLLALLLLMFAGSILNWITPGGLFQ